MKILVAVLCNDPAQIEKGSLLWVSRAGFAIKIFVPRGSNRSKFHAAIDEANYQEYLDLRYDMITSKTNALKYAQDKDFDLLVLVPAGLKAWNTRKNKEAMIIDFAADVGAVRKKISKDDTLHDMEFDNGTRMVRVVKL